MASDKQAIKDFQEYKESIKKASYINLSETPKEKEARKKKLLNDPDAFAKYYFPNYTKVALADFHIRFGNEMLNKITGILVKRWFRGAAKSTYAMIFLIMRMLAGKSKMILYVGLTEKKAKKLLGRIQAQLESNQRIINDFGEQFSYGDWQGGDFTTKSGVNFRAIGKGQSPRGEINDEYRPDTILVDDVDEDEECRNKERLQESFEYLTGTLYGSFGAEGGLFVMLNNRIAEDSLTMRVSELPAAQVDVVVLEKEDGSSAWPELFTAEVIARIKSEMPRHLYLREYQDEVVKKGTIFQAEWIQYGKVPDLHLFNYLIAYTDPGFKKTKTSDTKATLLIGLYKSKWYIIKAFCDQATVKTMIAWNYEIHKYVLLRNGAVQMWMEQVFLQDLLFDDFNEESLSYGYPLPIVGDTRKKPDKDVRIESCAFDFEKGNVIINEEEKDSHHMKNLVDQFIFFKPGSTKIGKDGPDAFEGGKKRIELQIVTHQKPVFGNNKTSKKHKI